MARSKIREDQVTDSDFLSEAEFATASGVLDTRIIKNTTQVTGQTIASGTGIVGNAYYLTTTDDTWLESDKNIEFTVSGRLGICSENNTIVYSGLVTATSHSLGDNSLPLYVSTSGTITTSVPTISGQFIKQVGFIEDANTINVQVDANYYELGQVFGSSTILASQSEAEVGTDNTVWMSPLRTKQAITAQVSEDQKLDHTGGTITNYQEADPPVISISGTYTIGATVNKQDYLLTAATIVTLPVLPSSGDGRPLDLNFDCGGYTLSWAASPSIEWSTNDNSAPSLTVTSGVTNRIPFNSNVNKGVWLGDWGGATG